MGGTTTLVDLHLCFPRIGWTSAWRLGSDSGFAEVGRFVLHVRCVFLAFGRKDEIFALRKVLVAFVIIRRTFLG